MLGLGLGIDKVFVSAFPSPVAAYSVRLLDNTVGINYSGNAMRVRRENDDLEIDIGFDSNGDLDEAAIAAHCTTNNGFVVKWYSQTGQYDAVKEDNASQGRIYSGSAQAVLKQNGKPKISTLTGYKTQVPSTGVGKKPSYSVVARNTNIYATFFPATDSPNYWTHTGSAFSAQLRFIQTNNISNFNTNIYSDTAATNGAQAHYLATNGGRGRYANSSVQFTKDVASFQWAALNDSDTLTSDFYNIGSNRFEVQEVILWADDITAINENVETYVNDYYSIY